MKLIRLFFAAALLLFAGCAKNEDIKEDSLVRIKAVNLDFKTTTSDGVKVKWEHGDRVALFSKGSVEDNSKSAVFKTYLVVPSLSASFTPINDQQPQKQGTVYLAAFPSSALVTWNPSPEMTCTMEFPSDQKVSAPGWDKRASLMAATSPTDQFVFNHCVAYIKFSITDEMPSIVSFSVTSGTEVLASRVNVAMAEDNTVTVTEEPAQGQQSTVATLSMEDGGVFANGIYYLAVLPKTYADGFVCTFTDVEGNIIEKKLEGPEDMTPGRVRNLTIEKEDLPGSMIDPLNPFDIFKKLRVSLIGDSISTYDEYIPSEYNSMHSEGNASYYPAKGTLTSVAQTYWYNLIYDKMEDAELDMNNSFRGTMVTRRVEDNYLGVDYCARVASHGLGQPDVVLIHGGTNDCSKHSDTYTVRPGLYRADLYLSESFLKDHYSKGFLTDEYKSETYAGMAPATIPSDEEFNKVYATAEAADTWEEIQALEDRTFIHAYVKLLNMIHFKHPDAKVVMIIGDELTARAEESIIKIAGHYEDMYGYRYVDFCPLASKVTPTNNAHPDAAGHAFMANTIYNQLESYLKW